MAREYSDEEWERFRETFRGIKRRALPSTAHFGGDDRLGPIMPFISEDPPGAEGAGKRPAVSLMTLRRLIVMLLLFACAPLADACICVSFPPKWRFKYSEAVVLVEPVSGVCGARVRVVSSFKGRFREGDMISVAGDENCGNCVRGDLSLLYLYPGDAKDVWGIGCGGIDVSRGEGHLEGRLVQRRAWWWRLGVSSAGWFPVRQWFRDRS